jgi:hypothetical protein
MAKRSGRGIKTALPGPWALPRDERRIMQSRRAIIHSGLRTRHNTDASTRLAKPEGD